MHAIHDLARRLILVSIVIAYIAFLTSCASGRPPTPVSPIPPKGQPPLPPPPPYESYRGEAAHVQKVLDNIQKYRHNDAPRPVLSTRPFGYPPPYPRQPGYPAHFTIANETDCKVGFYLGGPILSAFGLEAGRSVALDIVAGTYLFGVDTHLCTGNVPPLFGKDVFEAGSSYAWTLSQEDVEPKIGNFVIENNTGAKLTVRVDRETHKVELGTSSIELPEGSYTAVVSAKCGTANDVFDITKGSTYMAKYWCTAGKFRTQPPGYFVVNNNTSAPLTVKVAGETNKVPPGSTTIELPAGSYTAKISSRCGSTNVDLEIEEGSRYEGQYSCVVYQIPR